MSSLRKTGLRLHNIQMYANKLYNVRGEEEGTMGFIPGSLVTQDLSILFDLIIDGSDT